MGTSGWSMPTGIPGTGGLRSTPGPTTPSSSIDFRAQLPPGAPGSAAGMLGGTGAFSAAGGTIYSQHSQMSVNEFVARLKAFKNSPNQKDRDVLACVVKNLFEEYRFFHEYPERELRTTAEVYGGIIREGIISQSSECEGIGGRLDFNFCCICIGGWGLFPVHPIFADDQSGRWIV
uniref:CCR4-NOT transcription complex subunit 1 TTP binding domain-containing protein n=1 Tax=Parascaris equorum TaxID=6256 RepID=A0A914RMM6_PAREQ